MHVFVHTCKLCQIAVIVSVVSMIRGYHEYKLIWNDRTPGEELEGKMEVGNPDNSLLSNTVLNSFLANFESLSRSQC